MGGGGFKLVVPYGVHNNKCVVWYTHGIHVCVCVGCVGVQLGCTIRRYTHTHLVIDNRTQGHVIEYFSEQVHDCLVILGLHLTLEPVHLCA